MAGPSPTIPIEQRHGPRAAAVCAWWVCGGPCRAVMPMLPEQVLGRGFSAAPGLKGGESSLSWIVGVFFKDAVCIDRFLDDALTKKKNQCPSDCTRKGSRLVKKLQQAYWEMDFFLPSRH